MLGFPEPHPHAAHQSLNLPRKITGEAVAFELRSRLQVAASSWPLLHTAGSSGSGTQLSLAEHPYVHLQDCKPHLRSDRKDTWQQKHMWEYFGAATDFCRFQDYNPSGCSLHFLQFCKVHRKSLVSRCQATQSVALVIDHDHSHSLWSTKRCHQVTPRGVVATCCWPWLPSGLANLRRESDLS